jgi:UDP-glucose 4-epimerase
VITWVLGSGGLLGSALVRHLDGTFIGSPVPWNDAERVTAHLDQQTERFAAELDGSPWSIIWAAGAATTSSSPAETHAELESLRGLLTGIRTHLPAYNGHFFLTSSAGGVYAGSVNPPFDRDTPVRPLSAYGELKLAQETLAANMLAGFAAVTIGRVSNLYGPGQDLEKLQGLISRLALASITRQPINIFVPLDTIRDYIYVDDAAAMIVDLVKRSSRVASTQIEVVASGVPTTIGQLIQTMTLLSKKRVPVALGSHPSSRAQALDLRLEPSMPLGSRTPLPAGMKAVHLDILARLQDPPRGRTSLESATRGH